MKESTVTIGLLWHSLTSDNLGVGALTLANMEIARRAARTAGCAARFKILGWEDPRAPYGLTDDVEIIGLRARDLHPFGGKLYRAAQSCDLVLDIGAGDSFSDIYGPGRIAKMLMASRVVHLAGTPIAFSPQTIGPFQNSAIARAAAAALNRALFVSTRDDQSTQCAQDMGVRTRIIEASDVAIGLPFERSPSRASDQVNVGVNVSGLLFNGGYSGDNMFGLAFDYAEFKRALIARFLSRAECAVWLTPHVISNDQEVEDDYRAAQRLAEEAPGVKIAPRFSSPVAAKSFISGFDFFVGARMHACIAAFSSGVPTAPTAYSRKFAGLFGAIGYDESIDCRSVSLDEALRRVDDAYSARVALTQSVARSLSVGREKLARYEGALSDHIRQLKRRAA